MGPTLEKLKGHNALGLSVRPSVRPSVCSKFVMSLLKGHNEIL